LSDGEVVALYLAQGPSVLDDGREAVLARHGLKASFAVCFGVNLCSFRFEAGDCTGGKGRGLGDRRFDL
jgi:hypothetical protein